MLAHLLRQGRYDVLTTDEAGNRAQSDEIQLAFAAAQGRVLFTHDRDFEFLAFNWIAAKKRHAGIILNRRLDPQEMYQRILVVFEKYPDGLGEFQWPVRLPSRL